MTGWGLLAAVFLLAASSARAEVIEHLPAGETRIALTFDACEARNKPAFFDQAILDYLAAEKLPYTIFATGLFAKRNQAQLAELARSPLVAVENHSFDHPQHMERLSPDQIRAQVADTDAVIAGITGRQPRFFRFPAGNYDAATLTTVEATGKNVVHWSFASGDPAPGLKPDTLKNWVLAKTRPGDILIFHVNGRAPATATALPAIIKGLKARHVQFVRLDEVLK